LEQALAIDPNYARAYAALADSYITLSDYDLMPANEAYPKARKAALKALELDDSLAEAHTALAMIKANNDLDLTGAELAFKEAIKKNPHYPTAHQWYAELLAGMGRPEEALAQIHWAQRLEPLSQIIRAIEALVLNYARDYDRAIDRCQHLIKQDRTFGEIYAYLGFAYEQKGMYREAMDAYQNYSTLVGYNTPAATKIRTSPIQNAKDYWQKRLVLSNPPTGSDFEAAQALAMLGETNQALKRLKKTLSNRSYGIIYIKVHPNLDPLRTNPIFQEMLRRIHPQ
jgi:tetratricopeptide (TPR) repeat protein